MSYRTRNILLAAALALVAAVFMLVYIGKARSRSAAPKQPVTVLVAAHDIPAGTLGSTLQSGAFRTKSVPPGAASGDAISEPGQVSGEVVTQDILAGEQVSSRRFAPAEASGVRAQIRRDQRVVQLVGDANQVLDGTLKTGDRVDVLATWNEPENCALCHVSRTIVRNALVLRTSADLGTSGPTTTGSVPVQLRLTDRQAEQVFWMVKNGQWWLVLRPVLHPKSSRQGYDTAATILRTGLAGRGARP